MNTETIQYQTSVGVFLIVYGLFVVLVYNSIKGFVSDCISAYKRTKDDLYWCWECRDTHEKHKGRRESAVQYNERMRKNEQ